MNSKKGWVIARPGLKQRVLDSYAGPGVHDVWVLGHRHQQPHPCGLLICNPQADSTLSGAFQGTSSTYLALPALWGLYCIYHHSHYHTVSLQAEDGCPNGTEERDECPGIEMSFSVLQFWKVLTMLFPFT